MNFSLYTTGRQPAAANMALDQALLELHARGTIGPVLRLYGWDPSALTIGYSQHWSEDVDQDACARQGVPVVRRTTGGGAVFHDNEITYSLVAPAALLGENILESFRNVSRALVAALRILGLDAEFAPLNDITVNGKKISGNAQVRHKGSILQHGTILLGLDLDKMFSLLRVPDAKLKRKNLAAARDRVTSAQQELGRPVLFEDAAAAMTAGFSEWAGAALSPFDPPAELADMAWEIQQSKFDAAQWNQRL